MNKVKEFFKGLSKSTKITMISCGCFILLTLIILLFFVMFPITPSERAIAKIGGEGLVYQDGSEETVTTTATTTVTESKVTTTTTRVTTSHTSKTFTSTTVSGFLSGGYIRTGEEGVNDYESGNSEPYGNQDEEEDTPYTPDYNQTTTVPAQSSTSSNSNNNSSNNNNSGGGNSEPATTPQTPTEAPTSAPEPTEAPTSAPEPTEAPTDASPDPTVSENDNTE